MGQTLRETWREHFGALVVFKTTLKDLTVSNVGYFATFLANAVKHF